MARPRRGAPSPPSARRAHRPAVRGRRSRARPIPRRPPVPCTGTRPCDRPCSESRRSVPSFKAITLLANSSPSACLSLAGGEPFRGRGEPALRFVARPFVHDLVHARRHAARRAKHRFGGQLLDVADVRPGDLDDAIEAERAEPAVAVASQRPRDPRARPAPGCCSASRNSPSRSTGPESIDLDRLAESHDCIPVQIQLVDARTGLVQSPDELRRWRRASPHRPRHPNRNSGLRRHPSCT